MSSHTIEVTPEQKASNDAFLEKRRAMSTDRYIKRHSLQARLTHDWVVVSCLWLVISGLFVFCKPLGSLVGSDVVFFFRMSHRVIGVLFIVLPIISGILAPKGVVHILKNNIRPWDSDDAKWMALFFPYLFMARWIHMPDQREQKSGQIVADGAMWLICFIMGISGAILCLVDPMGWGPMVRGIALFFHDFGFFLLCVFGMAHIFLGAGLFQPYKGCYKLMFGNGKVSEADALYHWGHYARKEIESGENIIEMPRKVEEV